MDLSITRAQLSTTQADCASLRESSTEMQSAYSSLSAVHASAVATTQTQAAEISALQEILSGMKIASTNTDISHPARVVPSLESYPYGERPDLPLDMSLSSASSETGQIPRYSPEQNTSDLISPLDPVFV
jgi:hypothetical protein